MHQDFPKGRRGCIELEVFDAGLIINLNSLSQRRAQKAIASLDEAFLWHLLLSLIRFQQCTVW